MSASSVSDHPKINRFTHICDNFIHKVDELTKAFNKQKMVSHCFAEDCAYVSQHYKSCVKLLEEIEVWPPTGSRLLPELTLVCNCILVHIADKNKLGVKSTLLSLQLDHVICQTLTRVLLLALNTSVLPGAFSPEKPADIEEVLKTLSQAVEDPIGRFRLLEYLSRLVLLCSLCCIYQHQRNGSKKTRELLSVLEHLMKIVGQSVLQEDLLCQQGLLMCGPANSEDVASENSLCVGDVARLVLMACHQITEETGSFKHKQWLWLDTFLQCTEFIQQKQYIKAMKKLEVALSRHLDPEQKSLLLCQFAECYLQQGCSQLALQTYKDCLKIYKDHPFVYLHLANVYKIMGLLELEQESLYFLVQVLTEKFTKNEQRLFTTEIDALVMSVFQVTPEVGLPYALHRLAQCCIQGHRFKDAAKHYKKLLHVLKSVEYISAEMTLHAPYLNTDIRELVVEAVEAMALAQENSECLLLCDEFYPILSAEEIPSILSSQPFDISTNSHDDFNEDSQHNLFSQSQNSDSLDELMICSPNHQTSCQPSLSAKLAENQLKVNDCKNTSLTSRNLSELCTVSGKRLRSASFGQESKRDVWWSTCLLVRVLTSKADVLVATQGFTDETSACLTKAFNLLMDPKTSIFTSKNMLDSNEPQPKRCRLTDSENSNTKQSEVMSAEGKFTLERAGEFPVSVTWMKSLVNVASRMAKLSLERGQRSSILNSCHLILQLEPHNITAHYWKTIVLQDLDHQREQASKCWLQERGIDASSSASLLGSVIEERRKEIRNVQDRQVVECKSWWEVNEQQLLNQDITCLTTIIHSIQK